MQLGLGLSQELQTKVSPSLIALNQILALSSLELQEEIKRELESNPALEMEERKVCPTCGGAYKGEKCQRCLAENLNSEMTRRTGEENKSTSDDYSGEWDTYYGTGSKRTSNNIGDEEFDPITIVAAEMPMSERILADLSTIIDPDDMLIAEFLIGSLDERGYLSTPTEAVAQVFSTDTALVEKILQELQQVAPPGVGARDPRECLLIQVRYLKEQGIRSPFVEKIIDRYYTALGERKYSFIAQKLGITTEEVKQAREFIKSNLNPFPAEGQTAELNGVRYGSKAGHIMPDVIISNSEDGFKIEIMESRRMFLRVSPLYQHLSNEPAAITAAQTDQEREHIQHYVNRAKIFMANVNQRRQTMLAITEALVKIQADFLKDGVRSLQALTRSTLASYLGYHESTISRATAGKYVMLPNRKVIPYSDFFTASLSVKDVIKEIIETEESKGQSRLTDQDIVERLSERGFQVARRTVAKYRAQLRILPSTIR